MDATRSHTAGPTKATPNASEVVTVESALCSDLLKAGGLSMREIDKLIGELQRAYDYLKYEGERLQSQATRLCTSQSNHFGIDESRLRRVEQVARKRVTPSKPSNWH
jgi:hypothetical protein